jgi:hypothetical protein
MKSTSQLLRRGLMLGGAALVLAAVPEPAMAGVTPPPPPFPLPEPSSLGIFALAVGALFLLQRFTKRK